MASETTDPASPSDDPAKPTAKTSQSLRTGYWIGAGLVLGVLGGVLFGEYCGVLQVLGQAYVGLLQMTVLPYLVVSLIAKMGRLNVRQARSMAQAAFLLLLALWLIAIILIVVMTLILPRMQGATFFSPAGEQMVGGEPGVISSFVPANVFHSLSEGLVPAVVVFCLFFGAALILVPGKAPLLDMLDLCAAGIGRINLFLVRLAPIGLFMLTAAAAGTLRIEQLSRLQGYLIIFTLACSVAALGILPLLVSGLTSIRYYEVLKAAQEPLFTVIATGKLFVVLPQIVDKCEQLLKHEETSSSEISESTASVIVPLAYPFPHVGKILTFLFISFAAWYMGHRLTVGQTAVMAATGTVSSFSSPLISMPFLLDRYQLPQDLMALFILPGFITTRLADVVGVLHLMALTLIVHQVLRGGIRVQWHRLLAGTAIVLLSLGLLGPAAHWYLASTTLDYDLDERFLALTIPSPHNDVVVYRSRNEVPSRSLPDGSTLERLKTEKLLRVGYHPEHLPYSFFNNRHQLVGLDVELMHRLAERLNVRLEFVPYEYVTVAEQLDSGEIDVAIGGLIMTPERLLRAGFTQPYQTATLAVVLRDYRRGEYETWEDPHLPGTRLAVVAADLAAAARRQLPGVEVVAIDSPCAFFTRWHGDFDGLIIAAEEGAAWNVLYPEYAVVVPSPVVQRPVSMAVRRTDVDWLQFLDRWLEFERLDGTLDRLRVYWIEGGGTKDRKPRWSVMQNVLHWLP